MSCSAIPCGEAVMPRLQSVVDRVLTPRSPSLSNSDVSHPESSRLVELQRSGERASRRWAIERWRGGTSVLNGGLRRDGRRLGDHLCGKCLSICSFLGPRAPSSCTCLARVIASRRNHRWCTWALKVASIGHILMSS